MSSDNRFYLLKELSEAIVAPTEPMADGTAPSQYFISGICMQSEILNQNGRWYTKQAMMEAVEKYQSSKIARNMAFGELGHPEGPTINQDRVSHMIKELWWEGNNVMMKAKIIDTPNGRIVKTLIDEGATIGVSCRGLGIVKEEKNRKLVTRFHIATAADIVADPSAPDAFMTTLFEGKEFLLVNGEWKEEQLDEARSAIDNAHRIDKEAVAIACFEKFLSSLR